MARSVPVRQLREEVGLAMHELEITGDPELVVRNLLHRFLHLEEIKRPTLRERWSMKIKTKLGLDSGYIDWEETT